jgi:hypothetical protein
VEGFLLPLGLTITLPVMIVPAGATVILPNIVGIQVTALELVLVEVFIILDEGVLTMFLDQARLMTTHPVPTSPTDPRNRTISERMLASTITPSLLDTRSNDLSTSLEIIDIDSKAEIISNLVRIAVPSRHPLVADVISVDRKVVAAKPLNVLISDVTNRIINRSEPLNEFTLPRINAIDVGILGGVPIFHLVLL